MTDEHHILIAGAGGQGILFAGKLLANAAVRIAPCLTFFPSYGAEVRGGTSNCQIVISPSEIASPIAEEFESMLIMNQQSADKFLPRLLPGGIAVVNRSLCQVAAGDGIVQVAATALADELGDTRVANLILLGAFLSQQPVVAPDIVETELTELLAGKPPRLLDRNVHAFRRGIDEGARAGT